MRGRGRTAALLLFAFACGFSCHGASAPPPSSEPRSAPEQVGKPLFGQSGDSGQVPGFADLLVSRTPSSSKVDVSWAARCATESNVPIVIGMCHRLDADSRDRCLSICDRAAAAAQAADPSPSKARDAAPPPGASASATPAAPPPPPLDSFDTALTQCVARVRESGGAVAPVCAFDRPLDSMGFGQTHCNAQCAARAGVPYDGGRK